MVVISYFALLSPLILYLAFVISRKKLTRKNREIFKLPKWPLFGMLPQVLQNSHRLLDFVTHVLKNSNATFMFIGPCFTTMDMLVTCDPANINYILCRNFPNYPKGTDFNKIFDILGDGIFNSDAQLWEDQRRISMSLLNHHDFQKFVVDNTWNKLENGLMPVLDFASELDKVMDLQELFQRFTFDSTSILVLGHDPASLSISLPQNACEKAFCDAEEAVLFRHILPECIWKLQRLLGVGKEKNLSEGRKNLDQFIAQCISSKREKLRKNSATQDMDLLTGYLKAYEEKSDTFGDQNKFLRDNMLSLMFAGRDTTSSALTWFFWLLATNPLEESKVGEEIAMNLNLEDWNNMSSFFLDAQRLKKLVYLQGAIYEALRLYPPVPLQHKASTTSDILPSGHKIGANTRIILCFYSTARMETIWGEDCYEFKPSRWITENGNIKHEPSYKFAAFNAGPRSCVGKDMSITQMKIVAIAILSNYRITVEEGHPITPSNSCILQMGDGLKVKVTKRSFV